jgi:hypothetical protein
MDAADPTALAAFRPIPNKPPIAFVTPLNTEDIPFVTGAATLPMIFVTGENNPGPMRNKNAMCSFFFYYMLRYFSCISSGTKCSSCCELLSGCGWC